MIISRMRHEIKLRYNKLNSNHKPDLPDAYLDDLINDAINEYVEVFYSGNNLKQYRFGFEVTQQRIDMLSNLVVPNKQVTANKVSTGIYKIDLSTLNPKYKHFIRGAIKPNICSYYIPINIVTHNTLDRKLKNENTKPSNKWLRCLGVFKSENLNSALYLYVDSEITSNTLDVELEYIKQPTKVFSGGYNSLEFINGDTSAYDATSVPVSSEILYPTVVVDIVVQNLSRILEDPNKLTLFNDKIVKTT